VFSANLDRSDIQMDTPVYPFRYQHCSNSGWRSFLGEDQEMSGEEEGIIAK
jgi:hypothetical protein